MKKYNSHILAITAEAATRISGAEGYVSLHLRDGIVRDIDIDVDDIWIGSRNILEKDSSFKQVLPYTIIEQDGKFLTYQRTPKGGESRLHGNYSIGFGGHIDIGDLMRHGNDVLDFWGTIAESSIRELYEELALDVGLYWMKIEGIINDNSNDVGKVHLGFVYRVVLPSDYVVHSPEDQINLQGFKTIEELVAERDLYENWSALIIDHLNHS